MPRKDLYHETVKIALEKDGWQIVKEDLQIEQAVSNSLLIWKPKPFLSLNEKAKKSLSK
jgi:XisH protein